jgi:NAD(P)-dependent dehydrogenase (short-subunit alcohol dehydrogenase family)
MTRPSYDLRGKVALITGGTGGIGSATARELIGRGAKVAIVDVDPQTPQIATRMSSHSAMGTVADVCSREALDVAVADVVDRFGRVDVAIANAGILSRAATLRTTHPASIESLLAVNVTGVVNTIQAAMDEVIAHRGQFVLISSVFAFRYGDSSRPPWIRIWSATADPCRPVQPRRTSPHRPATTNHQMSLSGRNTSKGTK